MTENVVRAGGRAGLPGILAANGLTVVVALWQGWPLGHLMWPFWIQSLIIGGFARQRILALTSYREGGFLLDGRSPNAPPRTQRDYANLLIYQYGMAHMLYLAALVPSLPTVRPMDWALFAVSGALFWLAHWRSHRLNLAADTRTTHRIGTLVFLPYARVLPMHLCIGLVSGAAVAASLPAVLGFSALKTAADVFMHVAEHRWLQRGVGAR